jgi:DnaJ-class molecular chaperone
MGGPHQTEEDRHREISRQIEDWGRQHGYPSGGECPTCNGSGDTWASNNGYNRGTVASTRETCADCGGTGRR